MLSYINLLKGIVTLGIVIFCCSWGVIFLYKSRKLKAELLSVMGLMMICAGLIWAIIACDFILVLITGKNLNNPNGLLSILTWMWAPPTVLLAMYVDCKLLFPEKKLFVRIFISIFLILSIIWELFIFLDTMNTFIFVEPKKPNTDFYDDNIVIGSPASIISTIFFLFLFIFCIAYFYRGFKSTGLIRKKFLLLAAAGLLISIFATFDGLASPGPTLIIVRIGIIVSFWLWYLSLKEEHANPEEVISKTIEIEKDLFRIARKPELITEEEVTFHRERKICLVCKGKVGGFNFICPGCDALYCEHCARSLANLENACWVCNGPIDPSKPLKPYKEVKKEMRFEISRK